MKQDLADKLYLKELKPALYFWTQTLVWIVEAFKIAFFFSAGTV
ncbi:MAG: hypothetical protein R3C11_25820 [Planctomycetaceae bacterium]